MPMDDCHRLHYRWSQLEDDGLDTRVGSPSHPCAKADRVLHLDEHRHYREWPSTVEECPVEAKRFAEVSDKYKTIDYNTFSKNGSLKLTEIELYFMSLFVTKASVHEWLVVYLGIGNGERFRHVRDEYFPGLSVIAYDPIDAFYTGDRQEVRERARLWSSDGTNFMFCVRCFDADKEAAYIKEMAAGKKLLLISDIRGVAVRQTRHYECFDKEQDNELQWAAIQALRPVSSLLKFAIPNPWLQFYYYPPGVLLKQTFQYADSLELRLRVDGVPAELKQYNNWEIYEKVMFHHRHMRGLVYESTRHQSCSKCIDHCFDCTVLWDTVSTYARKNDLDAQAVLDNIVKYHIYSLDESEVEQGNSDKSGWIWHDVVSSLRRGYLMDAIAALEVVLDGNVDCNDWSTVSDAIYSGQPDLAQRLKSSLSQHASREDLLRVLGSLSNPFTFLRSDACLSSWEWDYSDWMKRTTDEDPAAGETNQIKERGPGKEQAVIGDTSQMKRCSNGLDDSPAKKLKF